MKKRVVILGSTGSIGRQTLQVIEEFSNELMVVALTANRSKDLLGKQIRIFNPEAAAIASEMHCLELMKQFPDIRVFSGSSYLEELLLETRPDIVVNAVSGISGLQASFTVLDLGFDLALANKESIVSAGKILLDLAKKRNCNIYPVDSEHSAIWQCMRGEDKRTISKILLTASGGPFRGYKREQLTTITPAQALKHPTWSMGSKISIDSATLMNKGLEVIEAALLFDLSYDQIEVVVHPQSIIHSMVEYNDGSIIGQLGVTDMRQPIQYALFAEERLHTTRSSLDIFSIAKLEFYKPDLDAFPCLNLAFRAGRAGKSYPIVLNTANQFAVERFLSGELKFLEIPQLIEETMEQHQAIECQSIEEVIAIQNKTLFYLKNRYTTS